MGLYLWADPFSVARRRGKWISTELPRFQNRRSFAMQNDVPPDESSPLSVASSLLEKRATSLRSCCNQTPLRCRMAISLRRKKSEDPASYGYFERLSGSHSPTETNCWQA